MTKARDFAMMVGRSEAINPTRVALLDGDAITVTDSAAVSSIVGNVGTAVYDSLGALPVAGLTAGQQAFVSANNRLYISNGNGWYNVASVNATPTLATDAAAGTIALTPGTPLVISLTATDSDNSDANLAITLESGGDLFKFATISQDSSVVTITPRTADSAATLGSDGSATLTFKASDGIGVASVVNTFTLSFSVADTNFTRFLLKADAGTDNQVDASTNTHTITEAGNVTSLAWSPYHPGGYSAAFVASNNSITIPAATGSEYRFGSASFTFEVWLYSTNFTNSQVVFHQRAATTARGTVLSMNTSGALVFYQGDTNTSAWEVQMSCGTITANTWHHVAIVRNGSGSNNYTTYLDGTQVAQASWAGSVGDTQVVGYIGGGDSTFISNNVEYRGYMRDLRYTESAVYTGNFTAPSSSLTVLSDTKLLYFNGEPYIDAAKMDKASVYGNPSTVVSVYAARHGPYDYLGYSKSAHAGSVYFDGNGDYLAFPDNNGFDFDGDFTIEFWFFKNANISAGANTTYGCLIGGNSSPDNGWAIYITTSNGRLSFFHSTFILNYDLVENYRWYHVVVARSGTALKMYVNGIERDSATNSTTFSQNQGGGGSRIGYDISANGYFPGIISDLRIVKGTAIYTSAFTPPTSPLAAVTNTQLLTCTNKNNISDISGMTNRSGIGGLGSTPYGASPIVITGFGAGSPAPSTTQRKFTDSHSFHFEGGSGSTSGEYYSTYVNEKFGTRDFTIEAWCWPASGRTSGYVVLISPAGGGLPGTNGFAIQSGKWRMLASGGWPINGYVNGSTAITYDTWQHVAVVRTGGNSKLYLNGTEESTIADTYNYAGVNMAIGCGYAGNQGFNGYIQDFRISRKAIYTGNFTPPTTTFEG